MKSLLVLVDSNADRRDALAAGFSHGCFDAHAVDPASVSLIDSLGPGAVALSLLEGTALLGLTGALRANPGLGAVPLAAVVPAGDGATCEAAWAAGVDEVLSWPDGDGGLAPRLRSLEQISRLRREVSAFDELLGKLVEAFERREPATFAHGARVGRISMAMGVHLGLSAEVRERMRRGALLHDIGTIVLADREMNQRGRLAPGALDGVRAHPVIGYSLLKSVPSLEPILPFVHRHHERIDGSGFPDGLRGSEIPLSVQVVALADAFDAMTSARLYRATFSGRDALETLREEARKGIWDPALISPLELAAPEPTPGVSRVRGAARARRAGPRRARQLPRA